MTRRFNTVSLLKTRSLVRPPGRVLRAQVAIWILAGACLALSSSCSDRRGKQSEAKDAPPPQRIVSMAPSITEVLFALGLDARVVGVTDFCQYPPAAQKKTKIGGFHDINYETLLSIQPDLVVLIPSHAEVRQNLDELDIRSVVVDQRSVAGIIDSFRILGEACGVRDVAQKRTSRLRRELERLSELSKRAPSVRAMIVVDRDRTERSIGKVFLAGKTFYDELLNLSGGENVYKGDVLYPSVSQERIIRFNPEVIIEVVPDLTSGKWNRDELLNDWYRIDVLDAAKRRRVYLIDASYAAIPGPRMTQTIEAFVAALHPGLDLEQSER